MRLFLLIFSYHCKYHLVWDAGAILDLIENISDDLHLKCLKFWKFWVILSFFILEKSLREKMYFIQISSNLNFYTNYICFIYILFIISYKRIFIIYNFLYKIIKNLIQLIKSNLIFFQFLKEKKNINKKKLYKKSLKNVRRREFRLWL